MTGYPLLIEARDVKVSEVEFNPDFISRILPKVDWDCLCRAAEQLGHAEDLPRLSTLFCTFFCTFFIPPGLKIVLPSRFHSIGYVPHLPRTIMRDVIFETETAASAVWRATMGHHISEPIFCYSFLPASLIPPCSVLA